ncbi:hypothetical protein BGW38_006627 [Lunasporangiospora selenospora]|uniref:[Histone H3]-trimethyl-L-lysine(4) demethylase n=1 Tax=Lunasporangiospora selenospora TaxID=979761 RepID=A0A9P6FYX3_9FUNG|nr:hypothetical protein BGW38_006627 [Lunasporangiospora selenospora]
MKRAKAGAVKVTAPGMAPALDMSSVRTRAPPEKLPMDPPSRLFGLPDAPCYYPTPDEFMEPLKFIESIRPEAEKAGLCKIVPPDGWKPPFAVKTETFRFKTRVQKLNAMEGETRISMSYLDQLCKFHRQQGHPVNKLPQLDKRPIDLYRLMKAVAGRGGYLKVTSGKKWAEIGRELDYTRKQCTSLSNALKGSYTKLIMPYEIYLSKQTNSAQGNSTPSSPSNSERMSSEPASGTKDDEDSDSCEVCHQDCDLEKMLICDGCELGYHMYCLTPPLQNVPRSDWFCPKCHAASEESNVEVGDEYSLRSFQQKSNNFKRDWFEGQSLTFDKISEDTVEHEFWRLIESGEEGVEVEYGADLNSAQHGSGFPTLERQPLDSYSIHPANLNNIPVLPDSLFSHINLESLELMEPKLCVGMCFSASCWRNEEHSTYSINYMHWGETKTWYGVPATDANKFEETLQQTVPDLFEQQPELLLEPGTMLSPERLVASGVTTVALDQRPGQFVVIFPQAYHAEFDHGFNFTESVNFATANWCHYGLECMQRYKEYKKSPLFSHDELILTTALDDTSIMTAYWLQDEMNNLCDRELSQRCQFLKQFPETTVVVEEEGHQMDHPQCLHCNSFLHLSQVGCECTTKWACLDHVSELCKCDSGQRSLRLRYTDEQLQEIAQRVVDTAAIPEAWIEKFRNTMRETRVPPLRLLKSMLAEAERIAFPIQEAGNLRKFVNKANEWVENATKAFVRKHHQGRRVFSDRVHGGGPKRLEDLQEMLREVERLRFDCPEVKLLEESVDAVQEYLMDARAALDKPVRNLKECRELYEAGIGMNISLDEVEQLEAIVKDLSWIERATIKGGYQEDFQGICNLVADAEKSGVSESNPLLQELAEKQETGLEWEKKASEALNRQPVQMEELRAVIEASKGLLVPRAVLSKAEQLYSKTVEWERMSEQLLKRCQDPDYERRPTISELRRVLRIAEHIQTHISNREFFEEELRRYEDWSSSFQHLVTPPVSKRAVFLELEEALEALKVNAETCTMDEKPAPLPIIGRDSASGLNTFSNITTTNSGSTTSGASTNVVTSTTTSAITGESPHDQPSLDLEIFEANHLTPHKEPMDLDPPKINGGEESQGTGSHADGERPVHINNTGMQAPPQDTVFSTEDMVYCICRTAESGMMVECDECHEWYHGPCVRVTKREVNAKSSYICPVCNLSLMIRREKPRPTLDQLVECLNAGKSLHCFAPEIILLENIVNTVTIFKDKVVTFLNKGSIQEHDILQVKLYLRKIEGLDIDLRDERSALRSHVLRMCPNSMPVPGVMLSTHPAAPPISNIHSGCLCEEPLSNPLTGERIQQDKQDDRILLQCGQCQDWYHLDCVNLHVDQAQRLSKYSCPVCCAFRRKPYPFGEVLRPDKVEAKLLERLAQAKEQADAKKRRRKSKEIVDASGNVIIQEERKKRPYKRRDPLENGDKPKPRRRKSSSTHSSMPEDMHVPIPALHTLPPLASNSLLPSFSEGFGMPSESRTAPPPAPPPPTEHPHRQQPHGQPHPLPPLKLAHSQSSPLPIGYHPQPIQFRHHQPDRIQPRAPHSSIQQQPTNGARHQIARLPTQERMRLPPMHDNEPRRPSPAHQGPPPYGNLPYEEPHHRHSSSRSPQPPHAHHPLSHYPAAGGRSDSQHSERPKLDDRQRPGYDSGPRHQYFEPHDRSRYGDSGHVQHVEHRSYDRPPSHPHSGSFPPSRLQQHHPSPSPHRNPSPHASPAPVYAYGQRELESGSHDRDPRMTPNRHPLPSHHRPHHHPHQQHHRPQISGDHSHAMPQPLSTMKVVPPHSSATAASSPSSSPGTGGGAGGTRAMSSQLGTPSSGAETETDEELFGSSRGPHGGALGATNTDVNVGTD